jgi:hypothetical protein
VREPDGSINLRAPGEHASSSQLNLKNAMLGAVDGSRRRPRARGATVAAEDRTTSPPARMRLTPIA